MLSRFLPLDLPEHNLPANHPRGFRSLFTHYDIPSDFIAERVFSVAHGSGSSVSQDDVYASWFHVLCKNIEVDGSKIIDDHPDNQRGRLSQSNFTWLRSAYFMCWTCNARKPVTLICFDSPPSLQNLLKERLPNTWEQVVQNPFDLWVVVLHELFLQMDDKAWKLARVFRDIENHFLRSAKEIKPDRESEEQSSGDFVGLHNVAKHCIYLKEAFAAIDYTQEELRLQHQEYFKPPSQELPSHHYRATWNMLKHKRGLFKSTSLRVESLNKRVENIINLAFNLVTAKDSRVMVKDSLRMETVATVTMFFLPVATVGVSLAPLFLFIPFPCIPRSPHRC
ncbi:hypothetical protein V8E54_014594 [Elaphomyces granulatus]